MNKEQLKKLQAELNSISEKKFSKLSDAKLVANDLVAQRNKNPEFIKKVQEGRKGFIFPESAKKIIGDKNRGKIRTQEMRNKISSSTKGVKKTIEHKENISKGLTGKSKSIEHRRKLSIKRIGTTNKKLSENNSKLNSTIYHCEHCNRDIGGYANYIRFHNDNCKHK